MSHAFSWTRLSYCTWDSSHHMLTPPLATLPDRTKNRLAGVRRRTHVFVSLEMVVMTPGEDEDEQRYKPQHIPE